MAEGGVGRTVGPGTEATRHPGQQLLEAAIWALALPTSPPARSTRDVLGLHLIQSALRLEHVDRVSEQLSLVDATHMARTIDIDVNIDNLPDGKEQVLTVRGAHGDATPSLYIPIARHPRESLGPVVLRDADGQALTRLTSRITNRLLAAGMIRLFRLLSAADGAPETLRGGDLVPTWLIEASILALVEDGRRDWPPAPSDPDLRSPRAIAVAALPSLFTNDITPKTSALWERPAQPVPTAYVGFTPAEESSFHAFHRLIQALTVDQVIVAQVPKRRRQTRISYQAPELRGTFRSGVRRLLVPTRDFTMEYTTTIPADVDSFHVSIQVPDALEVRRFVMVSDADHNADATTRYDLANLAHFMTENAARGGSDRTLLLRSELSGVSSRLDEIMRRRAEDYREYRRYLDKLGDRGGYQRPGPVNEVTDLSDLSALLRRTRGGRHLVTAHRALPNGRALAPAEGELTATELVTQLPALVERLGHSQLGQDLHVDNDPRESAGHIQWRRHATGLGLNRDQPVRARVFLALADSNPTAGVQVLIFMAVNLLLVAALVYASWYFSPDGPAEESSTAQSEVVVTLLLLVPGLLLNRLGLWPRRTLTARVRVYPLVVAFASIVVNVVLAVAIAVVPVEAISGGFPLVYKIAIGTLLGLVLLMALYVAAEIGSRRLAVPPFAPIPAWLRNEFGGPPLRRPANTSVTFSERETDLDV